MSMNDEPRMLIRLTSFGYKWTRNKYEINSICGRSIECTFSNCFWPILNLMLSINNAVRNHDLMIINGLNGPPFLFRDPFVCRLLLTRRSRRPNFIYEQSIWFSCLVVFIAEYYSLDSLRGRWSVYCLARNRYKSEPDFVLHWWKYMYVLHLG